MAKQLTDRQRDTLLSHSFDILFDNDRSNFIVLTHPYLINEERITVLRKDVPGFILALDLLNKASDNCLEQTLEDKARRLCPTCNNLTLKDN